jgi:hypothetical protein
MEILVEQVVQPNKWGASGTSGSDGLVTTSDSDHPSNLDNSVYRVTGVYGVEKRLGQSVYVNGKAGDVYAWCYFQHGQVIKVRMI